MPPTLTSSCLKPPPRDVLSIIDRNWEDLLSSKDEFRFESFLQAQLEEGQDEFQNIFAIHDIHAYCIIYQFTSPVRTRTAKNTFKMGRVTVSMLLSGGLSTVFKLLYSTWWNS